MWGEKEIQTTEKHEARFSKPNKKVNPKWDSLNLSIPGSLYLHTYSNVAINGLYNVDNERTSEIK